MDDAAILLSPPINFAVVQLPKRNFPGVVLQGDTLNGMVEDLRSINRLIEQGKYESVLDLLGYFLDKFEDARSFYEHVCKERGIELPYDVEEIPARPS